MWDSLSEKVYRGRTEKFTKEELKQRITGKKYILLNLESPLDRGKRDFGAVCGEDGGPIDHLFA
jgi:hypothetical protein